MENTKELKEKINELSKNAIIKVTSSWGLGNKGPGSKGIFVTNNKEIYEYRQTIFNLTNPSEDEMKSNYLIKIKDLNDEEFIKVTDFIENEILPNDFKDKLILDASWNLEVNYNGTNKKIKNDMEIYNKVKSLLDEMKKV